MERLRAAFDEWNNTININWNTKTEDDWIAEFRPGGQQQGIATPEVSGGKEGYTVSCTTPGVSFVWKVVDEKPEEPKAEAGPMSQQMRTMAAFAPQGGGWKYYTSEIPSVKGKYLIVKACRAGYKDSEEVVVKMK